MEAGDVVFADNKKHNGPRKRRPKKRKEEQDKDLKQEKPKASADQKQGQDQEQEQGHLKKREPSQKNSSKQSSQNGFAFIDNDDRINASPIPETPLIPIPLVIPHKSTHQPSTGKIKKQRAVGDANVHAAASTAQHVHLQGPRSLSFASNDQIGKSGHSRAISSWSSSASSSSGASAGGGGAGGGKKSVLNPLAATWTSLRGMDNRTEKIEVDKGKDKERERGGSVPTKTGKKQTTNTYQYQYQYQYQYNDRNREHGQGTGHGNRYLHREKKLQIEEPREGHGHGQRQGGTYDTYDENDEYPYQYVGEAAHGYSVTSSPVPSSPSVRTQQPLTLANSYPSPFYFEDNDSSMGVLDENWYDLQQSWIFSKHSGSLGLDGIGLGSSPQSPMPYSSMSGGLVLGASLLHPPSPSPEFRLRSGPGSEMGTASGLELSQGGVGDGLQSRESLDSTGPGMFMGIAGVGGVSQSHYLEMELLQEKLERQKWSQWAVQAAERERERRLAESIEFEKREADERRSRINWAISAVETEQQERLMKTYLSTLSSTNWFNEIISNFSEDYELVCPYYAFGCTTRCFRSTIEKHLYECKYKVQEDEIIRVRSMKLGSDDSEKNAALGAKYDSRGFADKVLDYEVVCPNTILGCSYSGTLTEVEKHLQGSCEHQGQTQEQENHHRALIQQQVTMAVEAERQRQRGDRPNAGLSALLGNQIQEALRSLHLQAIEFWEECQQRNAKNKFDTDTILRYLNKNIKMLWPFSEVEVTGSAATGIASHGLFHSFSRNRSSSTNSTDSTGEKTGLETNCSDLDLVVCFTDDLQSQLHSPGHLIDTLAKHFVSSGEKDEYVREELADGSVLSISMHLVLPNARVPLIKAIVTLTRPNSNNSNISERVRMAVDISMDGPRNTGIASTAMVRTLLAALPPLGPVLLLLKEFLRTKGLNNPYTGGLGSYGLMLMVLMPLLKQVRQGGVTSLPPVSHPASPLRSSSKKIIAPAVAAVASISGASRQDAKPPSLRETRDTGAFTPLDEPNHVTVSTSTAASTTWKKERSGSVGSASFKHAMADLTTEIQAAAGRVRSTSTGSCSTRSGRNSWRIREVQKEHGWRVGMMIIGMPTSVIDTESGSLKLPDPVLDLESPICGVVIEQFLRYFGEEMHCGRHGFSVREGGFRFELAPLSEQVHPNAGDPLVIEDPIDVMNNVSKQCYRAVALQKAFLDALEVFRGLASRWDVRTLRHRSIQQPKTATPVVHSKASANVQQLSRALSAALTASVVSEPVPVEPVLSSSSGTIMEEIFGLERDP